MLEDAADKCERIVCVQQLSERLSVANDDRQKIIKQRDLFNEQLKEERRQRQLLEEENSKLKKNFADVKTKKKIVEEKMEHLKDELADLKEKSDKNDRNLKRIRKERDDLKQNSRISREQKRLKTEYENEFEEMDKEYFDCLIESRKKYNSTVEEANATIKQLAKERDHYFKEYMKLLNYNEKKELLNEQVKQQVASNYPKSMKNLHENNRDVESNRDKVRRMPSPLRKQIDQATNNYLDALKDLYHIYSDVESNREDISSFPAPLQKQVDHLRKNFLIIVKDLQKNYRGFASSNLS
uniref:Uncharacterized protein n=1 Tax=Panagrolaimus sp. JU765 TaxID=591449 RepID=A0AC34RSN4_9BILA